MYKKRCVVCDKQFHSKLDRSDNITCSVACRSKLQRMRNKAELQRKVQLLTEDQESMMRWLSQNVPNAAHNLSKIKAVHGKEAFTLASKALLAVGRYKAQKN